MSHHARQVMQQILEQHPNGAALAVVKSQWPESIDQRTLQRYLKPLLAQGLVLRLGQGRSTCYRWVGHRSVDLKTGSSYRAWPLSPEAEDLRLWMSKPLSERPGTTYNSDFLEAYQPNQTFYLSKKARDYLLQLGALPNQHQQAGTFAKQILADLLIDLAWSSSRLEGNTYSLLETKRLIEGGQAAEDKSPFETRMVLNHKAALEFLIDLGDDLSFDPFVIRNVHALLSYNLLSNSAASGRLRTTPVGIGQTAYLPLSSPPLIEDCFANILLKADQINDPFEQAFFAMVHLPYLQPFVDVNKRVSRLAANIPLLKHNVCPLSFVDMPKSLYIDGVLGVYEKQNTALLADVFVQAYEHSCCRYSELTAYLTEPNPFVEQYVALIEQAVQHVVFQKLSQKASDLWLHAWVSEKAPQQDQEALVATISQELLSLHLGNIARFKITQEVFAAWQACWGK